MNLFILTGNVGADPRISKSQNGTKIANFSIATNDWDGSKAATNWHSVTAFGKTAETVEKYVKKGSQVSVTGSIKQGSREKDGKKVYYTDLNVNRLELLGGKNGGGKSESAKAADEDIPF